MKFNVIRRKLKGAVSKASVVAERRIPYILYSLSGLVFSVLLFCVVNLSIITVLSPRGKVLREYNDEKNALVEENRVLEQKIAQRMALEVISSRAEKELSMKRVESVFFVKTASVAADASVSQ